MFSLAKTTNPMFSLAKITFPTPITLTIRRTMRPQIVGASVIPINAGTPREFKSLDAAFRINPVTKTIHAEMPPMPHALLIYGAEDFASACGDTPEQHAERVLQCLGTDPASVLQALIDTGEMPVMPPRVPREIPNWRCKAVLTQMGLIDKVTSIMDALPEPDRTISMLAWHGDGKVARQGKTVLGLAALLGLTDVQVDAMFVAADRIEV
jgi:hypothetical protein